MTTQNDRPGCRNTCAGCPFRNFCLERYSQWVLEFGSAEELDKLADGTLELPMK